jgi:hypothetical protein
MSREIEEMQGCGYTSLDAHKALSEQSVFQDIKLSHKFRVFREPKTDLHRQGRRIALRVNESSISLRLAFGSVYEAPLVDERLKSACQEMRQVIVCVLATF